MAKILTPEQFMQCPKGTVFGYGTKWGFGCLLVLDEIMGPYDNGGWGFYAIDPIWVEANDCGEAVDLLEDMANNGASYPAQTSSTKYMNYDGDDMDWFIVFEPSDWAALTAMIDPALTSGRL